MNPEVIQTRLNKAIEIIKTSNEVDPYFPSMFDMPTMSDIIKILSGNEPKYSTYKQRKNEMIRYIKKELKKVN